MYGNVSTTSLVLAVAAASLGLASATDSADAAAGRLGRAKGRQPLRAALVLHGKLGSLAGRSVSTGAGLDVAVLCYATMLRHVIQANRPLYKVDTFGHSWSPEIGGVLDALYRDSREGPNPQQNRTEQNRT